MVVLVLDGLDGQRQATLFLSPFTHPYAHIHPYTNTQTMERFSRRGYLPWIASPVQQKARSYKHHGLAVN